MTAAAAEVALRSFLLRATSEGRRLVLVITGKGRPAPEHDPVPRQTGVLKRAVPEWLTRPPLSHLVLDWTEAHRRHGGSGALYVYLARAR
ncbi:Smr/MutS family protein [Silicimonas algicola]|nr:Smr/MutS family protein [Silicimonas algicola]